MLRSAPRLLALAVVPAMLLIGAGSAHAAQNTPVFLKLDGIQGETTNAAHPGEIDVDSFDFAVSNATSEGAGGGGGAGKATFAPIKFTKTFDKSSPALLKAVATGQHIRSAVFSFKRPGADGFLTYTLQDVAVSSYEQGVDGPLEEQVALTYSKISVSYLPVAGPPLVTAGWDVLQNSSL